MKNANLETCIVRVGSLDGNLKGTGFLITPTLAVTCAHVVRACGAGPGGRVRLVFRPGGAPVEVRVPDDGHHPEVDLAFLRLTEPLPEGAGLAVLGPSVGRVSKPVRAFGHPDLDDIEGLWGDGRLVGRVKTEAGQPLLQLKSTEITRGFSGGPVWDAETGHVIGMVTRAAKPDELGRLVNVAFAAPTETLHELRAGEVELRRPRGARCEEELAYLDELLTQYDYWRDHYTPLAGIAEVRAAVKDGPRLDLPMPFLPPEFEKLEEHGYGERVEVKRQPVDDLRAAVAEHRRIVLLGAPGSGKTTTLWRLAYDYALDARRNEQAPLPVLVPLGGYTDSGPFDAYLARHLGPLAPHLETYRASGRLILLLDGLNEMPQADYVQRVGRIRDVLERRPDETVVVTCRALDYVVKLERLQKVEIAPLDEGRIREFVHNYLGDVAGERLFWELAGGNKVRTLWETWQGVGITWAEFWTASDLPRNVVSKATLDQYRLWDRLRETPPPLLALCRNPYLLLMTAQVYAGAGGELPANRARLFAAFVDTLLGREQKRHATDWIDATRQQDALATLAYCMQVEGERGTTVDRAWALERLAEAVPDEDAERLLHLASSATLLDVSEMTVRFYHQLLQEYFAAREMGRRVEVGEPWDRYWPPHRWWEPSGWEETAILLAGMQAEGSTMLDGLVTVNPVVAARCLLEGDAQVNAQTRQNVTAGLVVCVASADPSPITRVRAGEFLARLGDPRNLDELVTIPAGPFLMGSSDADEIASDDEKPQRKLTLPAFKIGKCPVTNAQYASFVAAGGYDERRYWTEDGWRWKEQEGWTGPENYGTPFNLPNHPVVGISWYEALAYCRWLTDVWRAAGIIAPDEVVRLSTEAEWEKAARGSDGRRYPWGDDPDPNRANYDKTGIGSTSAVGCFPDGGSPYGCLDMAGNVWEWTASLWGEDFLLPEFEYPYDPTDGRENLEAGDSTHRVLRGGSFYHNEWNVRCAFRYGYTPDYRGRSRGCRVCVATLFSLFPLSL